MVEKRLTTQELEEMMTPEEKSIIDEWRGKIGQEFVPTPVKKALSRQTIYFFRWGDEVTNSTIRRWAIANEDFNALWFDEEYAKKSRWGGIIAPPLYLLSCNDGHEWPFEFLAYIEENIDKFPNHVGTFEAGIEWEFFEPVRPGDTISSKHKLADVYWKQSKEYRLLFFVGETVLTNQKGQLVATNRGTSVHLFKYPDIDDR